MGAAVAPLPLRLLPDGFELASLVCGDAVDTMHHDIRALIAHARALQLWFHGAHFAASGPAFYGDHKTYKKIYEAYEGTFDGLTEKAIAYGDVEVADPQAILGDVTRRLSNLPAPSRLSADMLARQASGLVADWVRHVSNLYAHLEGKHRLPLGLNDFLASTANEYESFSYKLQRRAMLDSDAG